MTDVQRPTFAPAICYRDPKAALVWLERVFGFEQSMVVIGADGEVGHSEMRFGDGLVMVGREWDEHHRSPAALGGVNTQSVHVQMAGGIEAHYERAKAEGAVIMRELADQFYGDRVYGVIDLEGHRWTFGQTVRSMSHEEMAAAGGGIVQTRL